jgi:hypothetical protein
VANKRKRTPHEKQMRFLTIFFGFIFIAAVIGVILLFNLVARFH